MTNDSFSDPQLAPLASAVQRGDADEIRRQLAHVHPDSPGNDGATLLVEAIGNGQITSVQALLDAGADPNRPGRGGETPVQAAAFADDPALLETLLARGGNPDSRNAVTGAPPLSRAILGQRLAQVRMLLDAGADASLADHSGDAPLHVAARTNGGAAILLLLEHGADATARSGSGASFQSYYFSFPRNALNDRALSERRQVVAWLKAHGVPLEATVESTY